jgi:hypothetical protein
MTEKSREYWQQWLSPGVIINLVAVLILIGGAAVKLSNLEAQVTKMQGQIEVFQTATQVAAQSSAIELVRYQERVATQAARISVLEDFKNTQEQVNVRVFSTLSKLGG